MKKKVTVTLEGGLTLGQVLVEGVSMNLKPISNNKWSSTKLIDIVDPLINIVSVIKGPYLTKARIITKINGVEKSFDTYSQSSQSLSYDKRDYPKSEFKM